MNANTVLREGTPDEVGMDPKRVQSVVNEDGESPLGVFDRFENVIYSAIED